MHFERRVVFAPFALFLCTFPLGSEGAGALQRLLDVEEGNGASMIAGRWTLGFINDRMGAAA